MNTIDKLPTLNGGQVATVAKKQQTRLPKLHFEPSGWKIVICDVDLQHLSPHSIIYLHEWISINSG